MELDYFYTIKLGIINIERPPNKKHSDKKFIPFSSFFFFSPLPFARLYLGAIEAARIDERNEKRERK